jgi:hypothetical protein
VPLVAKMNDHELFLPAVVKHIRQTTFDLEDNRRHKVIDFMIVPQVDTVLTGDFPPIE